MANEQNLIPANKRTKSEHREIAQKGGKASGVARRKKANLKKALDTILSAEINSEKLAVQLENMGFERTNEAAIAMVTVQKALKGDMRAVELIAKLNSNEGTKDSLDKKEQKERIKRMQLENEKLKGQLSVNEGTDEKIASYIEKVQEALLDEQT